MTYYFIAKKPTELRDSPHLYTKLKEIKKDLDGAKLQYGKHYKKYKIYRIVIWEEKS